MAFGLANSLSALLTAAGGALFNFSVATTIGVVRLTNSGSAPVSFTLWFCYGGTTSNDVDLVAKLIQLDGYQSIVLDGAPWNFGASSRISGQASIDSVVTCHITPATI
jgi:hypothetical protein